MSSNTATQSLPENPIQKIAQPPNISAIYDILPISEKTLLKRLRKGEYDFDLRNDRGGSCEWFIYDNDGDPVGVVVYYKGRKLVLHGIKKPIKE